MDIFGEVSDQSDLYQLAQYFFQPEIVNYSFDSIEMCRYVHRVYTELLLSKHFLYYVCDRPTLSERKRKLKLIEEFYSRLDYMRLKTFFENQQLFYESDLIGDADLMSDAWENSYYPFFYDNVYFSSDVYKETPVYRLYDIQINKLFSDRIKHKKLNDLNKIFVDE